RFCQAF
nr:NAD(+)-dependent glutamate dehydrogenase, GDH [Clostridium symbiosum, Peptide Partial, 6 aa] [[Clostridium] symbiosum]